MFEKFISVLPKIGTIACKLLNAVCNDGEETYLCYDLCPDNSNDVASAENYHAIFTNENGKLLCTNHSLHENNGILMHFPSSPLADIDDVFIYGNKQADVTRRFQAHANYNDGQFELTPVDINTLQHNDGANSVLSHVSRRNIPTSGTETSFGSSFTITVSGQTVTFKNLDGHNIDGFSKLELMPDSDQCGDGDKITMLWFTNPSPSTTLTISLPYRLDSRQTPSVAVNVMLSTTPPNNVLMNSLQNLAADSVPISENTLRIIENGRRLN